MVVCCFFWVSEVLKAVDIIDRDTSGYYAGLEMCRRRSEGEILMDVLGIASKDVKVTHLMYRANLSYSTLRRYLHAALDKGLVSKVHNNDGSVFYRTTEEGKTVLEKLRASQYSLFG